MNRRGGALGVCAICLLTYLAAMGVCHAINLLPNAGFETDADKDGLPDGWTREIHVREGAEGRISIDRQVVHSGKASLRIDHTSEKGWVRSSVLRVPAEKNALYRFSAWLRGSGYFVLVVYEFTAADKYITHNVAAGKPPKDWQEFSGTITTGPDAQFFKISLITNARGTVWFDDVKLELVASLPSLVVPTIKQAPKIDGSLADECWKQAAVAQVGYILGGEGKLAPVKTQALVVRDQTNLYVAFVSEEPQASTLPVDKKAREMSAWSQDRVEVFLQTADGYCHFGVAASGAMGSERTATGGPPLYPDWHSPWKSLRPVPGKPKFSAAASVGQKRWFAELSIPISQVGPLLPAQPWRAQFCRVRLVSGEEEDFTWSYTPGERFARPESFGYLAFEGPLPEKPRIVTLRDKPTEKPVIVPTPQRLTWRDGRLRLPRRMVILLPPGAKGRQFTAPRELAEDLNERYGLQVQVVTTASHKPAVLVGWDNKLPTGLPPAHGLKPEGYKLTVTPNAAFVVGADERGAFYGVQTIRQLVCEDAEGPYLPCCEIVDWPETQIRGWHASSPWNPESIDAWRRVIATWAALKYNLVVLEVNGRMHYDSYPDLGKGLTKQQMRELVQFARDHYLEPVPQLATFGHFNYVLNNPKYAHLGERFKKRGGGWARSTWNYCPSNPEVYKLVFALMDELIEVFQPKYFHIGHDEASFSAIGTCEKCSKKKPWELWAEDIIKLHDYLKAKGLRTMLWAEQFLEHRNGSAPYYTARALPLVPKDLIMCHWQYSPVKQQPDIKFFMDRGFQVLGSPWFWPDNVYYMAQEVHRYGALGFLGTSWYGLDRAMSERAWLQGAWVLGAENSWTPGHPDIDAIKYSTLTVARRLLFDLRRRVSRRWMLIDLGPYCNTNVPGTRAKRDRLEPDLSRVKPGVHWLAGIPVALAEGRRGPACLMLCDSSTRGQYPNTSWRIPIGRKVKALYFLHCTTLPAKRVGHMYDRRGLLPGKVGMYRIHYADGSQADLELVYWRNIDDWNSQLGPAQACAVVQTKTAKGAWLTLGLWRWENPDSAKAIEGIDFISAEGKVRPMLFAITAEL